MYSCQRDTENIHNSKYYVNLNRGSLIRNSKLAVCTKLTYDSVNAAQLVEWFEAQRVLGLSCFLLAYNIRRRVKYNSPS
jgi:hypothetical protein